MSDSAVGCLEVGATRAEVSMACGAMMDTTIHLEGMPQEAAWVDVGPARALAEIVRGAVWRIQVDDPTLRTADSIGAGTPLRDLAALPDVQIAFGEGTFARTSAHCGLSFGVEGLPFRRQWRPADLAALPDSVRVEGILILGRCSEGRAR